jgi:cytochrome c oxidase cbb3-type subunit I/II
MFLAGFVILAWNIWKTASGAQAVNGTVEVFIEEKPRHMGLVGGFANPPVVFVVLLLIFSLGWGVLPGVASGLCLWAFLGTVMAMLAHKEFSGATWGQWYERLLENALPFTVLTAVAVFIGGIVQIIPTVVVNTAENIEGVRQIPYTPLELAGRDIYVREGCYNCHSQQIRTLLGDVLRYGDYSKMGESIYDYPYQWGSKRTGPDLAREGGRYPNSWHFFHMRDPRQISPGSTMPNYPWLFTDKTDIASLRKKIEVQCMLGVPFTEKTKDEIAKSCLDQGSSIVADLKTAGAESESDREIIALIAYLQKLGKSEAVAPIAPVKKTPAAEPVALNSQPSTLN